MAAMLGPRNGQLPRPGDRLPAAHLDQALDDPDQDSDHDQDIGTGQDVEPAVVMRFGNQVDIKSIITPSVDADRSVLYLLKYLTKAVADTYADPEHRDARYETHIDRLHGELLFLPCSPECTNWLRYGVQPKAPGPGLAPGMCASRAHDRENLGLGGRRVQVWWAWSGKTLRVHRADRATVVRELLAEDGLPRYVWEEIPVASADYVQVVMGLVREAQRWRREYDDAKRAAGSRASPHAA